jgi:hypothetical protein
MMAKESFPLTDSQIKVLQDKIREVKAQKDAYFKDCETHDATRTETFFESLYMGLCREQEYYEEKKRDHEKVMVLVTSLEKPPEVKTS